MFVTVAGFTPHLPAYSHIILVSSPSTQSSMKVDFNRLLFRKQQLSMCSFVLWTHPDGTVWLSGASLDSCHVRCSVRMSTDTPAILTEVLCTFSAVISGQISR
jgi:hypothetical protein